MKAFDIDTFIVEVTRGLEKINNGTSCGNKEWTIAIKKSLIDIAEKYQLSSYCSLPNREEYKNNVAWEWMFDVILYSCKNDMFDTVYLCCESEWNTSIDKIIEDFDKLLFVRSKLRVMIYQVSEKNYENYKEQLINRIENSSSCGKGDRYLFGIYNSTKGKLEIEPYIKK